VLTNAYLARLNLSGIPPAAVTAVRQSIFGGVAVAEKMGSATLLHSVRTSFIYGMDLSLVVSAGVAVAGAILALVFMPARSAMQVQESTPATKESDLVTAS
jgi:hypothetical protein